MGKMVQKIKKWVREHSVGYWKTEYRIMEGAYNHARMEIKDMQLQLHDLHEERNGVYKVQRDTIKIQGECIEMHKRIKDLKELTEEQGKEMAKMRDNMYALARENRELKLAKVQVTETLPEEAKAAFEDKEEASAVEEEVECDNSSDEKSE